LSDASYSLSLPADSEICKTGKLRFADGVLSIKLQVNAVTIKTQTELGALKLDCGTCYWKKYGFAPQRSWNPGDTLIIKAGKDFLKILNKFSSVTANNQPRRNDPKHLAVTCKLAGDRIAFTVCGKLFKSLSIADVSGRIVYSSPSKPQSTIEISRLVASGLLYVTALMEDGSVQRFILPIVR
jgi:hypothetical protein